MVNLGRHALLHQRVSISILVPCIYFLPLFGVRPVGAALTIFTVIVCEIAGKCLAALATSWIKARNPMHVFVPAQEIGHAIEKTSFVVVCGEILFGTPLDLLRAGSVLRSLQLSPMSLKMKTRLG